MPSFQLVVRRGPKSGETFELKAQTVIIGRDSTADIIINDPEVSRNHCRLILDRSYYLQDLGSTNGTFVDGQRLGGEPVRLSNGQILQLGSNVTLLYQETELGDVIVNTMMASNDGESDRGAGMRNDSRDPAGRGPNPGFRGNPGGGINRDSGLPQTGGLEPAPLPKYEEPDALPQFNHQDDRANNWGQPDPAPQSQPQSMPSFENSIPDPEPPRQMTNNPGINNRDDGFASPQPSPSYQPPMNTAFPPEAAANAGTVGQGESSGGGFLPDWTRRQWIIASSVLVVVLLCACCFIIIAAVVVLQNNGTIPAF